MTSCDGAAAIRRIAATSLGRWTAAWDELVAQAEVPTPFLRSWWLQAVVGEHPVFVLVFEGDALIGGLALERRRRVLGVPVYQFIGSGTLCPDHLDVLAAPGTESAVGRAIAEWFTQPGSRVLDLAGLVENSRLEATFGSAGASVIDVAPWDELPTDGDYLAMVSPNLRKTLRRSQRRLIEGGITHRRVANGEADNSSGEAALREFVRLHHERGGRDALLREMPRLAPALLAGLAAGEVQIDILESADRVVLVWISFRIDGAVRAYQSARLVDRDLPNLDAVALLEVVRQARADGCHELDLLRGGEPYKARFVRRQREVKRLRVSHGVLGATVLAALETLTRARAVAGSLRRKLWAQRGEGFGGRSRRRAAE